jgi:hypothetical protein
MLKTECSITVYEVDGKQTAVGGPKLVVRSRGKYEKVVELEFDGKRFVVDSQDRKGALTACAVVGA